MRNLSLSLNFSNLSLFLFLFILFTGKSCSTLKYYVDSKSTCSTNCGTSINSFKSLNEAIKLINSLTFSYNIPEIYLKQGNFSGVNNRDLIISNPVSIKSWNGNSSNTIIDCQGFGYGFRIIKARQIILNGISIINCNGNYGAGIYISQTPSSLSDIVLSGNLASSGGGLYIKSSTVSISNCTFEKNNALEEGGGVVVENSKITITKSKSTCNTVQRKILSDYLVLDSTIISDTHNSSSQVSCVDSKFSLSNGTNVCGFKGSYCNSISNGTSPKIPTGPICPASNGFCGDNICDFQKESCLNCPIDCTSCSFSGFKLNSYKGCHPQSLNTSCLVSSNVINKPEIKDFLQSECLVSGVLDSYFTIDKDGLYSFKVLGSNLGIKLSINGKVYINAYFIQESIDSANELVLFQQKVNRFKLEFFGYGPATRNLVVLRKGFYDNDYRPFEESFYSLNVCGDNILDHNETCQSDLLSDQLAEKPVTCGDGICNEEINDCIMDCNLLITEKCSATEVVDNHLPNGFITGTDTLGMLIDNQQLWHLPGIEKFTMGVNVLTGESTLSPLFYFGYCNNIGSNLLQDMYRGLVYILPNEISAIPYPRCTFELSSNFYSTSSSMAEEKSKKTSYNIDGRVSFGKDIGGGANGAFQEEISIKTARELETRRSGSITSVESKCLTSKVELVKNTFHPAFLQDIGSVNTVAEMYPLLLKYGTYYHKTAIMGGKLTQVSVVDSSFESTSLSQEMEQHTKLSFGATVKAPMFNAKFDYSQSADSQVSFESQKEYESKSSRSTLITYGGAPASFNPSGDSVSDYESWAQTVDLYPVPIEFKLERIYEIIPKDWKSKNQSTYIHQLWDNAEEMLNHNIGVQSRSSMYTLNIFHDSKRYSSALDLSLVKLENSPYFSLTSEEKGYYVYEFWAMCDPCNNGEGKSCCNSKNIGNIYEYKLKLPYYDNINTIELKFKGDGNQTSIHRTVGTNLVTVLNWANGRVHIFELNKNSIMSVNSQVYFRDHFLVSFIATCNHGEESGQLRGKALKDGIQEHDYNSLSDFMFGDWEKMEIILYGNLGSLQHVVEMNDDVFPDIDKESKNVLLKIPKVQNIGRINKISMRGGNSEFWGRKTFPKITFSAIWVSQTYCDFYQQCSGINAGNPFNFISITSEIWTYSRENSTINDIRLYGLRD